MTQLDLDLAPAPEPPPPRRRRSFHIRSHVTAIEAQAGEARATRQDAMVLHVFERAGRDAKLAPSHVLAVLHGDGHPILPTSVRRSITNLTKRGLLIHYPGERQPGPHGAKESTWGLTPEEEQRG